MEGWAYIDVAAQITGGLQREGLVAVKLNQENGGLVVLGHGLCLVVQAAGQKGLPQV